MAARLTYATGALMHLCSRRSACISHFEFRSDLCIWPHSSAAGAIFFYFQIWKTMEEKYKKRAGSAALCELNPKTTLFTPSRAIQCELFHVPEFWKTHTRSSRPLVLQFSRFLDFHLVPKSWKLGTKQYNNMRDRQLSASYVDLRYCWPLSTSKGCRKLMTTKNN